MTLEAAMRAQRCLRAVWVLVSAIHEDAVAKDVEQMGRRLGSAIDAGDLDACAQEVEEVRLWLSTSAGVVMSRLEFVFEND